MGQVGAELQERASTRSPLGDLVSRVRVVVARRLSERETAAQVANYLRPSLRVPGLLRPDQRVGCPDGYTQHVLHVEADGAFSVVALVWLPGQSTPVHDHVSWCAVGVYEGQETEVLYRLAGRKGHRRLVVTGHAVNDRGSVSAVAPPGDIHRVMNSGSTTAISLHVYGADIRARGSSIRRSYDEAPGLADT